MAYSHEDIKKNLDKYPSWVARAIYRLSCDFESIPKDSLNPSLSGSDKIFFDNLREFFASNGNFTDRQIEVARKKIRDPYISYLAMVSNT